MSNLYIVSTPIGNLQDVTIRAAEVILNSKLIITESTSKAGILLEFLRKHFPEISNSERKIISLTEDEEESKIPYALQLLEQNDGALICEAGTPLVSDPGFKLVRQAIKSGVNVIPVPGASAVLAALAASGLPTDRFLFIGFLPKSANKKETSILEIKNLGVKTTVVAFESPQRTLETLELIEKRLGNVDLVLAREITKIHEEFIRGTVKEVIEKLGTSNLKGEITLVFRNVV